MTPPRAEDDDRWIVHGDRPLYESDWIKVRMADVSVPSGERFEHHTVWLPPAAVAVVLDDEGKNVLLTWRHRFVPDIWGWELVGGLLEQGEDPRQTVVREVEEETGYRPKSVEHLLTFEPMVGMVDNPHHVYLVRGVEYVAEPTEKDEGKFQWVPVADVPDLIAKGQVKNAGALVALLYVLAIKIL